MAIARVNRVYVIQYEFYESNGGAFKYALQPKFKIVTEHFNVDERDQFINRYIHLTATEREMYVDNIRCFTSILEEIKDMSTVINSI